MRAVALGSAAARAGLRPADKVSAVDGFPVHDELEFGFLCARESSTLTVIRRGHARQVALDRDAGAFVGIEFDPVPVRRCRNRCIFCFIDQLPRGLRKSLYIKDEDYRHSFLTGSYVTLTSATEDDLERIVEMGLSPLYISVHATDPQMRQRMLGVRGSAAILGTLKNLGRQGIAFHTQIVVCPGVNDGAVLERTIGDLLGLGEACLSVAVVPVGLTRHRAVPLDGVTGEVARGVCAQVDRWSEADRARHRHRRLFLADEFYLRAGMAIPARSYYEDYPQIENGVGLVRTLLEEWRRLNRAPSAPSGARGRRLLVLTSVSAEPFVKRVARGIERRCAGARISVQPVVNTFLGATVTVAGLLAASDLIRVARGRGDAWDTVVVPGVCLNHRGYTLDGYSVGRMAREIGCRVVAARGAEELLRAACGGRNRG